MYTKILIAAAVLSLAACSTSTPVKQTTKSDTNFGAIYNGKTTVSRTDIPEEQTFRVFSKGGTGIGDRTAAIGSAQNQAVRFCANMGKTPVEVRRTTSVGPHILGNAPRAELVFACMFFSER